MAETQVIGLAELQAQLRTLPTRIEVNVLRGALRAGQKLLQQRAQSKVPVRSGALRDSIKLRTNTRAARRGFARVDLIAGNKTAWYAHMVEFGTGQYYEGSGKSTRRPYIIKAQSAVGGKEVTTGMKRRALRFGASFVNQVLHPGIRPARFMRTTSQDLDGPALQAFVEYVQRRLPKELEKAGRA